MIKLKITVKAGTIELESEAHAIYDKDRYQTIVDRITKDNIVYVYEAMAKADGVENDKPEVENVND